MSRQQADAFSLDGLDGTFRFGDSSLQLTYGIYILS